MIRNPADGRFPTIYIHRGLCGISLKVQCLYIAMTYIMVNFVSLLISSLMMANPQRYINYASIRKSMPSESFETEANNGTALEDDLPSSSVEEEMEKLTEKAMIEIGSHGIELMVESLFMLIMSVLLLHGLRTDKSTYIFPWVIVNMLITMANFIVLMLKFAVLTVAGIVEMLVTVLFLIITTYFIMSVYSYYQLLKIRKAKVITFLNNEFQTESDAGPGYRILVEEDLPNDNPPPYSDLVQQPSTSSQENRPMPFTEKNVAMTDEEDTNKENVLYVQL
eukprot:TRINITY_DN27765_c0_g1_i1.p1 TRINITY_DN27765_c0_g1~~TRINITY_DN27765_c0_g1_i1.p1  ORF type:complete len:288 (-),score=63.44 TRINITY_DN27765_c0_g1_i1:35-871(-)